MSLIVLIGLFLKIRLSTENVVMNMKIISKIMHFSWPVVYHILSYLFRLLLFTSCVFLLCGTFKKLQTIKNRHRSLT